MSTEAGDYERFVAFLEQSEQMVHRLRDWDPGDTIYGVTEVSGLGRSGKTFTDNEFGRDGKAVAEGYFEQAPVLGADEVYLWRAAIDTVRTDPRNPNDPGEPPLKFARLSNAEVLDYKETQGESTNE